MEPMRRVTLVSHGPNCLDGLTCAVVAARYFAGRRFETIFASNREIDDVLKQYSPTHPEEEELWVTDISWRDRATDVHLDSLIDRGLWLYWVDHHKSALDRRREGHLHVHFTDYVLETHYAASRLLFEYLCARISKRGESKPGVLVLKNLVLLADDVDRWQLKLPSSRELALAVRAMDQQEAYRTLLSMDSNLTYNRTIRDALARVHDELRRTFEMAESTCHVEKLADRDIMVVAAECDDYAGEVADRWNAKFHRAVFVLYDHRRSGISFRRTPDCHVDLSRLAAAFGGGGHEAAAGCDMATTGANRSTEIARKVVDVLTKELDR